MDTSTEVKAKQKKIYSITEEEYLNHTEGYDGICFACGEWQEGGVEPDARNYECGNCGLPKVYGCEEALMLGRVTIDG